LIDSVTGLPPTVTANIDQFTGRTWLLPEVLDWYEDSQKRILLITGTGKSMIMAWLAGSGPAPDDPVAAEELVRLRGEVAAAHFCMAASRSNSPLAFGDNIASQLTRHVKGFGDALLATLPGRVDIHATQTVGTVQSGGAVTGVYVARLDLGALGDDQGFDLAFTRPLKKLYESGYDRPLLLPVDALEEAMTYTGAKPTKLLAGFEDLLDSASMEQLERDHAGTPAAATELLAVGLRGVSSRSDLGRKVSGMTIADVEAMDREDFRARGRECAGAPAQGGGNPSPRSVEWSGPGYVTQQSMG
jgi:hypothetical protein